MDDGSGKQIAFASEYGMNPLARNTRSMLWLADVASGETRGSPAES